MIVKYRVSDVAKDFGVNSKKVTEVLADLSEEPKKSATALTEEELNWVFDTFTQETAVENFDAYFAAGQAKLEAAKAERAAQKAAEEAAQAQEAAKAAAKQTADNKAAGNQAAPAQPAIVIPQQQKKKKVEQPAAPKTTRESRTVDTRMAQVNIGKYEEKFDVMAQTSSRVSTSDNLVKKQKLNQRSKDYRRPHRRRETETERLRRIQLERKQKQMTITVGDTITVGELAERLKATSAEIIKRLMTLGVMATVNQEIDFDTAYLIAEEMHAKVERAVVVTVEEQIIDDSQDSDTDLQARDPIVVVMGHVDHGKTSILDAIRKTHVTAGEAGGITQHIGAYRVKCNDQSITFLDTPGHAAFTAMRARGAQATDIAILVVAADDGIMPQTIEAINHAKAANVSIIVAINKMDKPEANPDRVKQQLTEHEIVPEEWGGDVICVPVSAVTGQGIDTLLETVLLVAEMRELRANPNRAAKGTVIEARLDKGRGPIATVLVQNGTLHSGDILVAGQAVGRVRAMTDENGQKLNEAGPSVPVEIMGLDEVPTAGDTVNGVTDERLARQLVDQRKQEAKEEQFSQYQKVTLDNLFDQMQEGDMKELKIIVKADVQGSVEAVKQSLEKLSNEEVRVAVIHGAVGAVSESDIMLADASNAIIVGFNVRPEAGVQDAANRTKVDMRLYRVIYDCIEEITTAMKGMLTPKTREILHGRAEVRNVFRVTGTGIVAGCYVLDGKMCRNDLLRIVRDGIIIADDKMISLRRFKDDQKEVAAGYECGIGLEKSVDIQVGDVYESYIIEEYRD